MRPSLINSCSMRSIIHHHGKRRTVMGGSSISPAATSARRRLKQSSLQRKLPIWVWRLGETRRTPDRFNQTHSWPLKVILEAGWSYPADIWNFGVMLWDLFEYQGPFDSINTNPGHYRPEQHLGLMIALLGPPPKDFLKRCPKAPKYFDADGRFKYPDHVNKDLDWEHSVHHMRWEEKELFLDFASKMLTWDPEERWTAKQLLEHDYLTKERDYVNTPSLSRASTASFNSMVPSRTGTPGLPPTSSPMPNGSPKILPYHHSNLPSRLLELVPSLASESTEPKFQRVPTNGDKIQRVPTYGDKLQRVLTNGSEKSSSIAVAYQDGRSASTSTLPLKPRMETLTESKSETNIEPPTVKDHTPTKSNQCSQDLIDSILRRGRAPTGESHAN